jgi:hypothetical protein
MLRIRKYRGAGILRVQTYGEVAASLLPVLDAASSEEEVQRFLEDHPLILPGLLDLHHGPWDGIVVSKLPLGTDYVTDFAFLTKDSQTVQITLIEIEHPARLIFTKKGEFTAAFNQAQQQLRDWRAWIRGREASVIDTFRPAIPSIGLFPRNYTLQTILVFGRRRELSRSTKRQRRWESLASDAEPGRHRVMTFDRLIPEDPWRQSLPTVPDLRVYRYRDQGLQCISDASVQQKIS